MKVKSVKDDIEVLKMLALSYEYEKWREKRKLNPSRKFVILKTHAVFAVMAGRIPTIVPDDLDDAGEP